MNGKEKILEQLKNNHQQCQNLVLARGWHLRQRSGEIELKRKNASASLLIWNWPGLTTDKVPVQLVPLLLLPVTHKVTIPSYQAGLSAAAPSPPSAYLELTRSLSLLSSWSSSCCSLSSITSTRSAKLKFYFLFQIGWKWSQNGL